MIERSVHALLAALPSVSESCGPVDVAMVRAAYGVVVPTPRFAPVVR